MANQSKAERKAALKAAKEAAKLKTKETQNAKETAKETVASENPEKKTEAPKQDPPVSKEKPEVKQKQKKEPKTPTIIPEEVTETNSPSKKAIERASNLINSVSTAGIPVDSTAPSLDGKAMLAFTMQQRYANNKSLKEQYPELYTDINRNIDVVTLLALVDIRQDLFNRGERGELNLLTDTDDIMRLQSMAQMLGIKLAPAKALPSPSDGKQMVIDFMKSEIPEELSKDAGKTPTSVPELDHEKVKTDEEVVAALSYLITKGKKVPQNIVNTVEWYRTYCALNEADATKKAELMERPIGEWILETFSKINATSLMQGIGRAVYLYASQTGSPCASHCAVYSGMTEAGWSEEDIASAVKVLVDAQFRYKQADDEKLEVSKDRALKSILNSPGTDYIDQLFKDYNADIKAAPEKEQAELDARRRAARMTIGTVRTNYFPKSSPTQDELRMKIGQILNLYRDPADRLAEYCQNTIIAPTEGEYPEKKESSKDEKKTKQVFGLNSV